MGKLKTAAVGAVLSAMTVLIVVLPWYASEQQFQTVTAQIQTWRYDGYQATTITDRDCVLMLCNGDISFGAQTFSEEDSDSYTASEAYASLRRVADEAIEDGELHRLLESTSADDVSGYERQIGFVVKDNRPLVLSVVNVSLQIGSSAWIDVAFEEKTQAVIFVAYNERGTTDVETVKLLAEQINRYFSKTLGLDAWRFRVEVLMSDYVVEMYTTLV